MDNKKEALARALGDIFLLADRQTVSNLRGEALQLRRREFQLLSFLANNSPTVINRYAMLDLIWDYESFAGSNTLEVHLCSLRRKLKQLTRRVYIETIRGVGYRLVS